MCALRKAGNLMSEYSMKHFHTFHHKIFANCVKKHLSKVLTTNWSPFSNNALGIIFQNFANWRLLKCHIKLINLSKMSTEALSLTSFNSRPRIWDTAESSLISTLLNTFYSTFSTLFYIVSIHHLLSGNYTVHHMWLLEHGTPCN